MSKKTLQGIVKSTKMTKTLVVAVNRVKKHPKYKKRYIVTKRYKAHYEEGKYSVGDRVFIEESSPISKDKRWRVKGLVKHSQERRIN